MSTQKMRRKFSSEFKAKVALEALKEKSSLEELAKKYELHPVQISTWKKEANEKLSLLFGKLKAEDSADTEKQMEKLYAQIGQLKVENDFLKKRL
jgi:transposase